MKCWNCKMVGTRDANPTEALVVCEAGHWVDFSFPTEDELDDDGTDPFEGCEDYVQEETP